VNFANYSGLHVVNDQVFFKEEIGNDLEEALRTVKELRPFLLVLGIEGAEAAFRKLEGLKRGESYVEGFYILAKNDRFWLLKRGPILGDPTLDRAILAGEPVTLTFPGGEISFKAWFSEDTVNLKQVSIRWAGETVYFDSGVHFYGYIFGKNPIVEAIKTGLDREFGRLEDGARSSLHESSPEMLAFLRAFVSHENPLQALAGGEFRPYVVAEFFTDMF